VPELRQNIITRDWVIIATERSKRPDQFARSRPHPILSAYQDHCPFCLGNEDRTPDEFYRLSDLTSWRVRAVPNKFPALASTGERIRKVEGIHRSMTGVGFHEVIIEHPRHDITTALMDVVDVENILKVYRQRYIKIMQDPRIEAIVIFKNHGEGAGTSLEHPHSQLAATPVVPFQVRARIEEAIRYFDDTGECVFCSTLKDELSSRDRLIYESEYFVAFIPFAALSPFHIWIFPRHHASSFHEITDLEISDLAVMLKTVLAKLYFGLNNPDFNYSIRSIPLHDRPTDYFHWYIAIVPRVSIPAGFELGSGMYINSALPEESAKYLREIQIPLDSP